jgi:hypothetical protein
MVELVGAGEQSGGWMPWAGEGKFISRGEGYRC